MWRAACVCGLPADLRLRRARECVNNLYWNEVQQQNGSLWRHWLKRFT